MGEPRLKSRLLVDVLQFLDVEQRRRFFVEASPALSDVLLGPPGERAEWAPMALFSEGVVLVDRIVGTGDLSMCWAIGLFVAQREVGPVQSLALKVLRPSILISLAPSLFSTHFQSAGRVTSRAAGERALVVSFPDFPDPDRAKCLVIGGWMQGWLGLGPRRDIRVEHVACRCLGAASCDYAVAWDD